MKEAFLDPYNAAYAQELYERWLRDPSSVDEGWRRIFAGAPESAGLIPAPRPAGEAAAATDEEVRVAKAAAELVDAYRLVGHFAARLNPLGAEPQGHPMLEPAYHDIAPEDLERGGPAAELITDVLRWLRDTYSGTIGYEFEHIEDPGRREWLRQTIETGAHLQPLSPDQQKRLLERLTEVEALEQFLHKAYLGQKRFSIEGLDMMVPMLDLAIERGAAAGAREVVLGMAHRGRLNVLAHVLGRPYGLILGEFEGRHAFGGGTGDVKYHLGAEGTYATASGEPLTVTLSPNPSHLEFVDPVVEGMTRAKQERRTGREVEHDGRLVLPVLIHGDAAFSAQGVVAETLNMAELAGYATGGTLHIVANNQIGFTTLPRDARSTFYASDLALGFNVPVFHVNADDPAACLSVVRIALAYRERFAADVVIDLVGYRRFGHNEGDEPAYTQPRMYELIAEHPPVRRIFLEHLAGEGVLTEDEGQAIWDAAYERLVDAQTEVKSDLDESHSTGPPPPPEEARILEVETALPADRIRALDQELHSWPDGFQVHPKLARQLERRAKLLSEGEGPFDWAHAEALAFASLVTDGTPVRLTGQDSERGTFSQRHLVLHDVETGEAHTPIAAMKEAKAPFTVRNSPLSEAAAVGFEYGYAITAEEALVLWEAQFGDFANGAQVIIDQFIASGRAKWGQTSRLVLLLPHGYEGQGPEHSSARIERFLQLAAEDNLRVANCSTPAQYFHLLRRQALLEQERPLIVFTPKSLLRHPKAVSDLDAFASGAFQPVIDDPLAAERPADVRRVVLCSGKVYYDLLAQQEEEDGSSVAVLRMELLYPFPAERLTELLQTYGEAEEIVWVQEEPKNMGAWRFAEPRLHALADGRRVRYIGRPERASPAEGYLSAHQAEQKKIVKEAFASGVAAKR